MIAAGLKAAADTGGAGRIEYGVIITGKELDETLRKALESAGALLELV